MKYCRYLIVPFTLILFALSAEVSGQSRWQAPFDKSRSSSGSDSLVTLQRVLDLVASGSPLLSSLDYREKASRSLVDQAGKWANPELAADLEELHFGSPGFSESELTVSLSQEIDLFGQRTAGRKLASAEHDATRTQTKVAGYELFLETKSAYYSLAHAQMELELTKASVKLSESVVENIKHRMSSGAALELELLLAQLEMQRHQLHLSESEQKLNVARMSLVSMWGGEHGRIAAEDLEEPDESVIDAGLAELERSIDSTRILLELAGEANILEAQMNLARREAYPSIGLNGGFKRLMADGSGSFLVGFSLPLPLWDRNKSSSESLRARRQSIDYDIRSARVESRTAIRTGVARLNRLIEQHRLLDDQLLPTAEETCASLKTAYQAGRISYDGFLEAERFLVELRFEHNDMLLAIYEQIIELERITGVTLDPTIKKGRTS